jgi:hypothetical protein
VNVGIPERITARWTIAGRAALGRQREHGSPLRGRAVAARRTIRRCARTISGCTCALWSVDSAGLEEPHPGDHVGVQRTHTVSRSGRVASRGAPTSASGRARGGRAPVRGRESPPRGRRACAMRGAVHGGLHRRQRDTPPTKSSRRHARSAAKGISEDRGALWLSNGADSQATETLGTALPHPPLRQGGVGLALLLALVAGSRSRTRDSLSSAPAAAPGAPRRGSACRTRADGLGAGGGSRGPAPRSAPGAYAV